MKSLSFLLMFLFTIFSSMEIFAQTEEPPSYKWSTEKIFQLTNRVRAGKSLAPKTWPNGARVAVLLSFDVDNETVELRNGGVPSIGAISQGEYGARVGLKRVVDLLVKENIPASYFIPGISLMLHPEMADEIKRTPGYEFALHGWIHERNNNIPPDEEERLLKQAYDYISITTGYTPVGYRAPSWNFSPHTLDILLRLGLTYDSSLMADESPYEILKNGEPTGLVELPVEWILDDAPLLNPIGGRYSSPDDMLKVYSDEFDKAYEEGTMFLLTMHPHYIGHRSRIVILEKLIKHIKSKPGVWFATHKDAADYVRPNIK